MSDTDKKILVEVMTNGTMPVKAHADDAGFDLFAAEAFSLMPGEVVKVPLGVKMALPPGTWGNVTSKSGLGAKGLLVYAGVIDCGYRGEIHAVVTNLKHYPFPTVMRFERGQKIAQLLIAPYRDDYQMVQVAEVPKGTSRGDGGFGSTGA